jgi:hypothetical protein
MRREERIAEMMKMARELAGRGHRPQISRPCSPPTAIPKPWSSSSSRISSGSFETSPTGLAAVQKRNGLSAKVSRTPFLRVRRLKASGASVSAEGETRSLP